jgi:hypothetical protein
LTSKLFEIKILRALFAKARPDAAFQEPGGGVANRLSSSTLERPAQIYFSKKSTGSDVVPRWSPPEADSRNAGRPNPDAAFSFA